MRALLISLMLLVGCNRPAPPTAKSSEPTQPADSIVVATGLATSSATALPIATSPMPADPPAPLASMVTDVPDLEAKAAPLLATIWQEDHRAQLRALLTVFGEILATGSLTGEVLKLAKLPENANLEAAAAKLYAIEERTNALPTEFAAQLDKYLTATQSEPNMGVWSAQPFWDYSAVAAWLRRNDPRYLRAMLAARSSGLLKWDDLYIETISRRRYLQDEFSCFGQLAQTTKSLTSEESAAIDKLFHPRIEKPFMFGSLEYRIRKVSAVDHLDALGGARKPTDGAIFILVEYEVRNLAKASLEVSDRLRLSDSMGRQFTPSTEMEIRAASSTRRAFAEVQPGVRTKLTSIFELPSSLVGATLFVRVPYGDDVERESYTIEAKAAGG